VWRVVELSGWGWRAVVGLGDGWKSCSISSEVVMDGSCLLRSLESGVKREVAKAVRIAKDETKVLVLLVIDVVIVRDTGDDLPERTYAK